MNAESAQSVVVVDIKMPFWSMVGFMVKWAIASIPALLILFTLGVAIFVFVGGLLAGMAGFANRQISTVDIVPPSSSQLRTTTTLPSAGGVRDGVMITPQCAWPYNVNEPNAKMTCQMFYSWTPEERERILTQRAKQ